MKVACIVNPLVHTRGPCFSYGRVEALIKLIKPLRREARCECMLIAGTWFKTWARQNGKADLLTGLRTVWLDELLLYRRIRELGELPTALDQTALQDDAEHPALRVIAEVLARKVDGFEPDIVIGFAGEANYLAKLWPTALRLHVERGQFGRDPYPFSIYFDHVGTHARSAIGRIGRRKLADLITPDGRMLVSAFRSQMAAALGALDPFRCHNFRSRFDRLCLLPLQISNEFCFDGMVNYRTQFEYLYDVLAAAPADVGVLVTEHPNGEPILRRSGPISNLDALGGTFPNMIFLDEFRRYQSPAQFLVPRVDGVWSVSSSVGHQALLFGRILGSPPSTELSNIADETTFENFFAQLGKRKSPNPDTVLAWMLERYLVPAPLLSDGRWLHDYFQRRLDAARSALDPIDAFVPTADADRLMDAWIVKTPARVTMTSFQWEDDSAVAELHSPPSATRERRAAQIHELADNGSPTPRDARDGSCSRSSLWIRRNTVPNEAISGALAAHDPSCARHSLPLDTHVESHVVPCRLNVTAELANA
jgi:hypothetical protein